MNKENVQERLIWKPDQVRIFRKVKDEKKKDTKVGKPKKLIFKEDISGKA